MRLPQGPITPRLAALVIILFFIVERAASLGYLLPEYCVEDERWIQEKAVKMVREHTLDPGTRKYPGLMFTLTAGAYSLQNLAAAASIGAGHTFVSTIIAGRLLVIALAAVSLGLAYKIFRREWGDETAVLAILLLATCPGFLFVSQVLKNDVLVVIAALAAVAAALKIYDRGSQSDYLLAGAVLGFALAAKYHFIAVIPLLIAHRLRHAELSWLKAFKQTHWLFIFPSALIVLAFLSPYTLMDLAGTIKQGMLEINLQNRSAPLLRRSRELWWQWPVLFQFTSVLPLLLGVPLYLTSIAGIVLKLDLKNHRHLIIFSYPIALLAFMIVFSELGVPHLYAPAAPFFALAAAGIIAPGFNTEMKWKRAAATAAAVIIAGLNLLLFHGFIALEQDLILNPTREMVRTHVPGTTDVALVPYFPNPDLDLPVIFYPQFLLNEQSLADTAPDRILVHHTFYNAYLNHRELTSNPEAANMVLAYLNLQNHTVGYKEEIRWQGNSALLRFYQALFPDLQGLRSSIYAREAPGRKTESNSN